MANLASLVVSLELNSAALRAGLDQANTKLDEFGKKLNSLAQVITFEKIGGLAKEAAVKIGEFVLKGAEAADRMGKLAQSAGLPVEAFSRLNYAAGLSGVSADDLGKAFSKLNINLAKAGAGGRDQVALFSALGVKVKDTAGHVRDGATVMKDLATVFAGLEDGASKSSLAIDVFGKAGAALLPLLNMGADGMAALGLEADKFGITVSQSAAASAEVFNDNLQKVNAVVGAVAQKVAANLTPAFGKLTDQLLNSQAGADLMKEAVEGLTAVVKVLASGAVLLGAVFEVVGSTLASVASAAVDAAHGDFDAALNLHAQYTKTLEAAGKAAKTHWDAIWTDESVTKKLAEHGKKNADALVAGLEAGKTAITDMAAAMKSLTGTLEEWQTKAAEAGAGDWVDQLNAKLDSGKIADELKKIGAAADEMRAKLFDAAMAAHDIGMAKLALKVDFDVSRTATATKEAVSQRQIANQNLGDPQGAMNAAMAGFKSFDDALEQYAKQTALNARMIGDAEVLKAAGDEVSARRAIEFADAAKLAADKAGKAADAFEQQASQLSSMIGQAIGTVTSKMGEVGNAISAGLAGFKSGGPLGAILGVIMELATSLEGFGRMVTSMNKELGWLMSKLSEGLAPLFDTLISSCEGLNEMMHSVLEATFAFEQLWGIMRVFAILMDTVQLSTLYVGKFFMELVGKKDLKLDKKIGDLEKDILQGFDKKPAAKVADGLHDVSKGLDKMGEVVAKVTDKYAELLTNLPSGYKIHGLQFAADGSIGGASAAAGGAGSASGSNPGYDFGFGGIGASGSLGGSDPSGLGGLNWSGTTFTEGGAPTSTDGGLGEFSEAEWAIYLQAYCDAIAAGASGEQAKQLGLAAVAASKGKGSSSSAATAGSGGGGGFGSSGGIHSTSDGGGDVYIHLAGDLVLQAKDPMMLHAQLREAAATSVARQKRNSK